MGSKQRIGNKLRQNDEYTAICRYLEGKSLTHTAHPPTGHGHPYLLIDLPNGETLRHSVACTPRGGGHPPKALAYLRKKLREAGYQDA